MFLDRLKPHRAGLVSAVSGVGIAGVVATIAIVSAGYTAQRVDVGDGSVWVANNQQQAIGRANPQVLELNSVVETGGTDLEVLQSGDTVLLVDRAENRLDIIDPATSTVTETVALPPDQPEVRLAGGRVVVHERGTGEVWIVPLAGLATFDAESAATLSFGLGAVLTVAPDGMLWAYAPSSGTVFRVPAATSDEVDRTQAVTIGAPADTRSITAVGDRWAVLDSTTEQLFVDGRSIALGGVLGTGTTAVLQDPSLSGDAVLVAHSGGLISVPFSGAAPAELVGDGGGAAAPPVVVGDCEFAAWAGGAGWRRCAGGQATALELPSMSASPQLAFMVNGGQTVLNDRRSGDAWAVQRTGELIANWDDLIVDEEEPEQQQENDETTPPEVETVQQPPVAIDDSFGARAGRATVLPVLLNDFDPNGDVLVVESLSAIDETVGRLDLINERQQVQLTLADGAAGAVGFTYTISDGRGGTATGTVTVAIRTDGENSPPEQVRTTDSVVQSGGRTTVEVLSDWVDPDGDAMYLQEATVEAPDTVTYKPEGTIVYSDSGSGSDLKLVSLVVSDGSASSVGGVAVTVRPAGEVPLIPDPFVVLAYAGQEVTVAPLDHVRGGSGVVRLVSVPAKPGVTITPSYETGTFKFVSEEVRTHYLEYVVTDGVQTVTGVVRVDVAAPPDANTKPITIPKTVFVQTLRNARVDVAGTDIDPAGGVLLVTGVMNLPAGPGVRAEVLEQRFVRVSLDAPLEAPVTFNYRVSNGLAEAEGVITVVEVPPPARVQPPVAADDTVTVRPGETIDIPVLRNDEHPDGLDLSLSPELAQDLPDDGGLLFASGRILRYLAPDQPGDFTAAYNALGPDGQAATALVRIAVREADPDTNNPPVPETVTARVLAGEQVRIRIPLAGTDPDGDAVQLLGQATNPQKGAVIDVEGDRLVYQAGEYSAGTDTFTYTVIDALGARSTGTVRIGISPRLDGARNPVAIVDVVTVRPGFTVSVQVLANDSDPDGSPLRIVSAEPNDEVTTAEIVDDIVRVRPPDQPGDYGVIYRIENEQGGTSQNFIRVHVDPDAPLAYPVANDTVLSLSDILDRETVTVDVLSNVFFADGDPRSLGLSVYQGYGESARVTSDRRIEVTIRNESQIIPFRVSHPEDESVASYAFIRVPGFDDALPQLDRRAPALVVNSEQELVIELNDYVVSAGGRVRLTDASSVQATHANGDDLVLDADTLVFTSADTYFGPASISFEVVDGEGRSAGIVLPISVRPRENQPPTFIGAVLEFEPGQERVIDLLRLTSYPYPDDVDELVYTVLEGLPEGFRYALNGSELTLRAENDAKKGSTTSISLGVRDDLATGQPGRIQLSVVQSTRPLLQPGADIAIAPRGQTTTIDVLANDEATNPFPGQALTVLAIRGLDGAGLPAGVQIQPTPDSSGLRVTVSGDAPPGDVSLQYQVVDATADPERAVWGSITVSVQDRPDPVSNLLPTGFSDGQITMRWNPGQFNNSPITLYRVSVLSLAGTVISTQDCPGSTCTIGTPGNGPANSVRVSVVAVNGIGPSDAFTSEPVWSDIIPPAPTSLSSSPLDHGLRVSWNEVTTPAGGSAVNTYRVVVGGVTVDVSPASCGGGTCAADVVDAALANGVPVAWTVSPRNDALTALSVWNTSEPQSGIPAGPPIAVSSPLATAAGANAIALDWGGVFSENGRSITDYTAAAYTGSAPTCSAGGSVDPNGATIVGTGTGTSTTFGGLAADGTYTFVVFAYNGQGCTASAPVVAHTPPPQISALTGVPAQSGTTTWDIQLTGGTLGGGPLTGDYTVLYRVNGGSERPAIGLGDFLFGDAPLYGGSVVVEARACRSYDSVPVCQDAWSPPIDLGVAVSGEITGLSWTSTGGIINPAQGSFDWLSWPSGAYESVQYACGTSPGGSFVVADTSAPGHCESPGGLLQPTSYLTIRVVANGGQVYDTTYQSQ